MRRTKAEAARTREAILDAALECFDCHGIGGTTLEQVAAHAQVTKGAVYHHFRGKAQILAALREQVSLPFLDAADTELLHGRGADPLARIERFVAAVVESLEKNPRKRRAMTVMQFRCEYAGPLLPQLAGVRRNVKQLAAAFEAAFSEARGRGELAPGCSPRLAALETLMFMNGMVRLWLLDDGRAGIRRGARAVIRSHMARFAKT